MKIIKQGNPEIINKPKKFSCSRCGCVFEADKNEYKAGNQYNDIYFYAECPCCKANAGEVVNINLSFRGGSPFLEKEGRRHED